MPTDFVGVCDPRPRVVLSSWPTPASVKNGKLRLVISGEVTDPVLNNIPWRQGIREVMVRVNGRLKKRIALKNASPNPTAGKFWSQKPWAGKIPKTKIALPLKEGAYRVVVRTNAGILGATGEDEFQFALNKDERGRWRLTHLISGIGDGGSGYIPTTIRVGGIHLDGDNYVVRLKNRKIKLTPKNGSNYMSTKALGGSSTDDPMVAMLSSTSDGGGLTANLWQDSGMTTLTFGSDEKVVAELLRKDKDGNYLTVASAEADYCPVGIAVDGNRDGSIQFSKDRDRRLTFWLNNDNDEYYEYNWYWHDLHYMAEDDKSKGKVDSKDGKIDCLRDLEDFARIYLRVSSRFKDDDEIEYKVYSQWFEKTMNSTVKINLFEQEGKGLKYLENKITAKAQKKKKRILACASRPKTLDKKYLNWNDAPTRLLFEGVGGRSATDAHGRVVFSAWRKGIEISRSEATLDLLDSSLFYDYFDVGLSGRKKPENPLRKTSRVVSSALYRHPQASGAPNYIIYVHGWRMGGGRKGVFEKKAFVSTMFKRLWWQGYKGSVGIFSWPELQLTSYNDSEFRGWWAAGPLLKRLRELKKNHGNVNMLAHSQGNVVAGEALRMNKTPKLVHTYFASQAAVPAHAWDSNVDNEGKTSLPNLYAHYSNGKKRQPEYFDRAKSSVANRVNFYGDDFALRIGYVDDNKLKPLLALRYEYLDFIRPETIYSPPLDKFVHVEFPFNRILTLRKNRYEIFSWCLPTWSNPLGMEKVDFTTNINLTSSPYNYPSNHYAHSRQFRSNIADEWPYWNVVFTQLTSQ
ncbi:MAG: alpha/beta hydrolase [Kiritimatiellaeota bacterium]|nr:alpha/beta hydrolase [Kiritimatiellota bacterium]